MTAKKIAAPESRFTRMFGFARSPGGKAVLVLGMLAVAGGGWYALWRQVGGHVTQGEDYLLNPHDIVVTPQPRWVHADVKSEVIRNASFDTSLSILDEELTLRVAQAFALHPWIEKVSRVSKSHPARVEVEVAYRQPAAMVEVAGGLLPVDREGFLLPTEDFSSAEARSYPRLAGIATEPVGPMGKSWGDPRVVGGAHLAALVSKHWQALKLVRIVAGTRSGAGALSSDERFELWTQAGSLVVWGRPPGREVAGEMAAQEKLERLLQFAADHEASLDPPTGAQQIDLHSGHECLVSPRTAARVSPGSSTPE